MVRFSKAYLLLAPLLGKVLALPTEAVEEDVKVEIVEDSGPFGISGNSQKSFECS
jgi:hypothetical protein